MKVRFVMEELCTSPPSGRAPQGAATTANDTPQASKPSDEEYFMGDLDVHGNFQGPSREKRSGYSCIKYFDWFYSIKFDPDFYTSYWFHSGTFLILTLAHFMILGQALRFSKRMQLSKQINGSA